MSLAVALGLLAGLTAAAPPSQADDGVTEVCRFSDGRFTEISGMTMSQRHPGILWLHNDSSGGPVIYAVDASTCATVATLTIAGIEARDLESIAAGRDAQGRPVLWLGDIGDNVDSWPEVRIHRIREPRTLTTTTVPATTYRLTYRDRPHNAETLLADPSSTQLWLVTKQLAHGRLYVLPKRLSRTQVNIARPQQREGGLVTDGAVSPDGTRYVLRDYVNAVVFAGLPPGAAQQTIPLPLQLQGEAITWTADGRALLVTSERDDRLLRVELPVAVDPVVSSPVPTRSSAGAPAVEEPQPVTRDLPWLALGLVMLAGLVIAIAEWRRRRPPGG